MDHQRNHLAHRQLSEAIEEANKNEQTKKLQEAMARKEEALAIEAKDQLRQIQESRAVTKDHPIFRELPFMQKGFDSVMARAGWGLLEQGADGVMLENPADKQTMIISVAKEQDGHIWAHLSISGRKKVPTWAQLVKAKEVFIGAEVKAIQVLPEKSTYVNIDPNCLHLFCPLTGNTIPDFHALIIGAIAGSKIHTI